MKTKIWEVKFVDYYGYSHYVEVVASNAKEAIRKAIWKRRGESFSRLQDITKVRLVAEDD